MRGTALHDRFVWAVAALFLCVHLAWLPGHLEDIDSINFALGMRDYDVAAHQPHPPGYPVFTALARGSAHLVGLFDAGASGSPADFGRRSAIAMALLSAVAGALALLALYRVLRLLDGHDRADAPTILPLLATTLTAATPLFWVTAARPLSDMTGLAGALGCKYLLLRAARDGARLRCALGAAVACGVAAGLRSQVTWLVVPLLVWLLVRICRRVDIRAALAVAASALAGVMTWAVPMVTMTGGLEAYRSALTSQAGEDFDGVPMLAMAPDARRFIVALGDTFVSPWSWWPMAAVVLLLACAGVAALGSRRRLATWMALAFVPYLAFHLLFQETETTRYALPLVPVVVTSLVVALQRWLARSGVAIATVLGVVALATSIQAHRQYVETEVSIEQVLARMEADARQRSSRPQVIAHRRVWAETRRARQAITPSPSFDLLPAPRSLEWQGGLPAWQRDDTVWWLVDPIRGDRVTVDPRSMQLREHVAWPLPAAAVLGGMRPHPFDWYDVSRPQWILRDGWSLTPELAGLTAAAGQGLPGGTATALVRGSSGEATVVVGGRSIADASASPTMEVRIGTSWEAATWRQEVALAPGPFAFVWRVPSGAMPMQGYVPLMVAAGGATTGRPIFLEQFDVQPAGVPVVALGQGWYEPERDVATGRTWRWVGDTSDLRIVGSTGDVRLTVAGTYPRHIDRAPVLEIFSGTERVATHTLSRPFRIEQVIASRFLSGEGRMTWRVSPSFVAGERTGSADARRLALEIAALQVDAIR